MYNIIPKVSFSDAVNLLTTVVIKHGATKKTAANVALMKALLSYGKPNA